jgi:hypothetical protein
VFPCAVYNISVLERNNDGDDEQMVRMVNNLEVGFHQSFPAGSDAWSSGD